MSRSRPGSPRVAVAYLRVSTEDQKLGPEAQRAAIEAWAASAGVTVSAWHVDAGVSGGSDLDERPGLIEAMADLKAAKAGVLVIAKRDRLARDVAIAAMIERAVNGAGAKVVSADGIGNGDTPAEAFMRSIIDAAAAYERALIRARTRAALAAKKARGERAGTVPFGYVLDAAGRLAPDANEQAIIAEVLALRDRGVSLRGIVAALEGRGFRSRAGKPLQLTQVARIVRGATPSTQELAA
jgi:DNA invertase Pin-like site-specific DNA recombinase